MRGCSDTRRQTDSLAPPRSHHLMHGHTIRGGVIRVGFVFDGDRASIPFGTQNTHTLLDGHHPLSPAAGIVTVSYTHLTLPTILLV